MTDTCPFLPTLRAAIAAGDYPDGCGVCITCPDREECVEGGDDDE